MIKYNFRYVSTDNYELSYTSVKGEEKTIPFRRTIAMAKKIQGVQATARLKMYQELTEQGITKNDLIIKKGFKNEYRRKSIFPKIQRRIY